MLSVDRLSQNLIAEKGIWVSKHKSPVSYPAAGNAECFALEEDSWWFQHRNNSILAIMKRFPPHEFMLDIGGGNGWVARNLINHGIETVLLEPGEFGVKQARKRKIPQIIKSTLEDAELKTGSVPSAGMFDLLEHIRHDREFLKEVHRIIRPDGRLYITVPAHNWLYSHEDVFAGHIRRYSRKTLEQLLQSSGFEPEYISYYFSLLVLPVFFSRVLPYRLKLIKTKAHLTPKDYVASNRLAHSLVLKTLSPELLLLKNYSVPIGASLIAVGRKV